MRDSVLRFRCYCDLGSRDGGFAACPFWGWLAVAVQLTLLVLSILHYRSKPYDCVYTLPVAMSAIWFVYMAIRLLF